VLRWRWVRCIIKHILSLNVMSKNTGNLESQTEWKWKFINTGLHCWTCMWVYCCCVYLPKYQKSQSSNPLGSQKTNSCYSKCYKCKVILIAVIQNCRIYCWHSQTKLEQARAVGLPMSSVEQEHCSQTLKHHESWSVTKLQCYARTNDDKYYTNTTYTHISM